MELVDMRGLKPRPFWVLVRVQARVLNCFLELHVDDGYDQQFLLSALRLIL